MIGIPVPDVLKKALKQLTEKGKNNEETRGNNDEMGRNS
jgi:hypothetical protein